MGNMSSCYNMTSTEKHLLIESQEKTPCSGYKKLTSHMDQCADYETEMIPYRIPIMLSRTVDYFDIEATLFDFCEKNTLHGISFGDTVILENVLLFSNAEFGRLVFRRQSDFTHLNIEFLQNIQNKLHQANITKYETISFTDTANRKVCMVIICDSSIGENSSAFEPYATFFALKPIRIGK